MTTGEPVDPSGQVPGLWFQEPPASRERRSELPAQDPEQRWHFDVWVPHDEGERRLQAVLDAGGTLVSDAEAPSFWVVADADGNRSCICTPLDRADAATRRATFRDSRSTSWDDWHTGLTPDRPGDDGCRMRTDILVRTRRVS